MVNKTRIQIIYLIAIPLLMFIFGVCAQSEAAPAQDQSIVYCQKGWNLLKTGNIEQAVPYYQKAIALNPNCAQAYNDLGIIFETKGNIEEAERMYLKAIEIAPDYPNSYSNLALLYERQGDYANAKLYWERSLELGEAENPYTEVARQHIGEMPEGFTEIYPNQQAQYEDLFKEISNLRQENVNLITEAKRLINLNTELETKLRNFSLETQETKQIEKEEYGVLQKINAFKSQEIERLTQELLALKGENKKLQQKTNFSKESVKEINELMQENAKLTSTLEKLNSLNAQLETKAKEMYLKAEDEEEAKKSLSGLQNMVDQINQERIVLKKTNEELEQRAASSENSLKVEGGRLYQELGTAYTKAKLFDLAIEAYLAALKFNPNNAEVHYNLGLLYKHYKDDSKKAVYHLEKYLQLSSDTANKKEVEYLIKMLGERKF